MVETAIRYVVETPEGGWQIAGSGVSLDSVVFAYREGLSAEVIVAEFPTLTLEQVHGAIAFYLRHRTTVDRHLDEQQSRWADLKAKSDTANSELLERVRAARNTPGSETRP